MMLKAVIVDDTFHTREGLSALIAEKADIEIVASCGDAAEAIRQVDQHHPEVLFIGLQMSMLDGFKLLGMLHGESVPHVVFVTTYDHDALLALEEKGYDYLLKPIDPQRLAAIVAKIGSALRNSRPRCERNPLSRIPCGCGNRIKLIDPQYVEHIHSDQSGVHVFTCDGSYYTELTLKVLEQQLGLFRCHKQYLVNLERVSEMILLECGQAEIKTRSGQQLPVSRRYLRCLKEAFQL